MDKQEAAEKLTALFGNMDYIGVIHSILVETSRYFIIILFLFYTWHCFTVAIGKDKERKEEIYGKQNRIMFVIHFIASLILFLNSLEIKYVVYYLLQLILLLFMVKAFPYVYQGVSKLVLNNMLMLISIGFIMIERINPEYVVRQMFFAALICIFSLFIPYIIEKFPYFDRFGKIYAIVGILLLALVFVIGKEVYGAKNWIIIGGIAVQPSEFVKIFFVFFAAAALARSTAFYNVVKVSVVAAIHVLILVVEKDLGAALIFFITYLLILYVASENPMYLLAGGLSGAAAAFVAYKIFYHVQVRVAAWQDPWSDIAGKGYQVTQSLFAIGTGGWFGMGLGEGAPNKVPVAESDFIFSAICEELGTVFGICIILVEISCFVMFVNIALQMTRRFYKLTALGLAIEYIFQVFLTLGGVTKFIPSTGVTLPLISYGGSSIMSTVILFSIIQGMYVLRNEEEAKNEKKDGRKKGRKNSGRKAGSGKRRGAEAAED